MTRAGACEAWVAAGLAVALYVMQCAEAVVYHQSALRYLEGGLPELAFELDAWLREHGIT